MLTCLLRRKSFEPKDRIVDVDLCSQGGGHYLVTVNGGRGRRREDGRGGGDYKEAKARDGERGMPRVEPFAMLARTTSRSCEADPLTLPAAVHTAREVVHHDQGAHQLGLHWAYTRLTLGLHKLYTTQAAIGREAGGGGGGRGEREEKR